MKRRHFGLLVVFLISLAPFIVTIRAYEPVLFLEGEFQYGNWYISHNGKWITWGSYYGEIVCILDLETEKEQILHLQTGPYRVISESGDWLYFNMQNNSHLYLHRINLSNPDELEPLFTPSTFNNFALSPAGDKIAYSIGEYLGEEGNSPWVSRLYIRNSDGSGEPTLLLELPEGERITDYIDWSIHNQLIFTTEFNDTFDVRVIDCFGDHTQTILSTREENIRAFRFRWSPDGSRLCYINYTYSYLPKLYVANADLTNPHYINLRCATYGSNEAEWPFWLDNHNIVFKNPYALQLYRVNIDEIPLHQPTNYLPLAAVVIIGISSAGIILLALWLRTKRNP